MHLRSDRPVEPVWRPFGLLEVHVEKVERTETV